MLQQRTGDRAEQQARFIIDRQVSRLRRRLDDLHDLSSITVGKIAMDRESLDARDGDSAVIEVADNGRGIAAGVLPRIFDLFVQEPGLQKSGLGIGLHVVRRLV